MTLSPFCFVRRLSVALIFFCLCPWAFAQSASISASSTSTAFNATITITESVTAAPGDSMFNNYAYCIKPDGTQALLMSTYADYLYINSRTASGTITLDQSGQWRFYAYGYTGDAPRSQQVIQSNPLTVTVAPAPIPASATISASASSVAFGAPVTISATVQAASGDTLFEAFASYTAPDGTTGYVNNIFVNYYYRNSYSSSGSITLNQSGQWKFYSWGYTGDAPGTQQVIPSTNIYVTVGPPPAPTITSAASVAYAQRQPVTYQITASNNPTSFSAQNLPPGVTLDPSTGQMSGLSTGAGTFSSTIYATGAGGTSSAPLSWTIAAAVIAPSLSITPGYCVAGDTVQIGRSGSTNNTAAWTELTVYPPDGTTVPLPRLPLGSTASYTPSAGPGTYTFQYRVVDIYNNYADANPSPVLVVSPQISALPYSAGFESSEGYIQNSNLQTQLGWVVQHGSAEVISGVGVGGGSALRVDGSSQLAQIVKFFSSTQNPLYLDLYAEPATGTTADTSSYIDFGLFRVGWAVIGGQGAVMAYNGNGAGSGSWQDTGVRFAINASGQATSYLRITAIPDFPSQTWSLVVNGNMAVTSLHFISSASSFTSLVLVGHATQASFVDQISFSATNPFSAPSVPAGISFSAITDHSATVSWTASSSSDGVQNYEVSINGASLGLSPALSRSLTGLTPFTQYTISVRAFNNAGYVSAWGTQTLTSAADMTPPGKTVWLPAQNITSVGCTLYWSTPSDNIGVTGYQVKRADNNSITAVTGNSLAITGLVNNVSYTFTVQAHDAAGNWGAWSDPLVVTTVFDPNADDDGDGIKNGVEQALGTNPESKATSDNTNQTLLNVHNPR